MSKYYEIESLIDNVKKEHTYLSETKKEVIDGVKGNYPQLCTYESEWIYFDETGYNPGEPVEIEYQTVEGTNCIVENAIPYKYKSAILKGNTIKKIGLENGSYNGYLEKIPMNNRLRTTEPVNGYITIRIDCKDGYQAFIRTVGRDSSWNQSLSITLESERPFVVLFKKNDDSVFNQTDYGSIIEYTNIAEISDNNGNELVSVKMPVLTTSNEDGTKSNILTVNEPIELRRAGDIQDELNLLTGEVTERVGEVVLDGSEDWVLSAHGNSTMFYTSFNNLVRKEDYLNSISCDKLVVHTNESYLFNSTSPNGISAYADWEDTYPNENWIYIKYADSEGYVEKLKQCLSQNPITVQYELATESVKTVDLTPISCPFEGYNKFTTSSDTIPPSMKLEIPVVSTGEQTLQEIND